MMRRIATLSLMVMSCTLVTRLADAYEVDTHEEISERAIRASDSAEYLSRIGLQSVDDTIMWQGQRTSLAALVRFGANSEDDFLSGALARYRHHFFDPLPDAANGGGLTTTFAKGLPSPDWGLEDKGDITEQEWSLKDARQYLYDALTLSEDTSRKLALPRTFVALGHAIHLIQDAAQPQHVRNDSHGGSVFGPKSLYERYTNRENVLAALPYVGYATVRFDASRDFWATDEKSGVGEGIAEFTNNNFVSARTNFNLLGGNVVPNARYLLPIPVGFPETVAIEALVPEVERCQVRASGKKTCLEGKLTFFKTEVNDKHTAERQINPRASTLSIFDADLQKYNIHPKEPDELFPDRVVTYDRLFTLNRFNFDAAHKFLIPRAVAYSAGLIDYFFRGRLEAIDPTFTDDGVSLKVKNAIDAEKVPEWENENLYAQKGQGQLVVTVKYKQGEEEKLITSDAVNLSSQEFISPGETADELLSFQLPPLPDDATNVEYRLVFRGRLGQEDDAIAVGLVESVSGFVVSPNYVATAGPRISGPRVVERRSGRWQLTDHRNPQVGNVDWKGWYVNGQATKVLTWWGPTARYFPDPDSSLLPFRHDIYQKGEAFALAPYRVLGAGITRDSSGREWLVAICWDGSTDIVFRRPNKRNTSAAPYDPVTNPDGWQELGRFPSKVEGFAEASVPWFFNGEGVEAQTVRLHVSTGQRHRLKMILVDTVATVTDENNLPGIVRSSVQRRTCQQEYSADSSCDEAGDRCLGLLTIQALNGTNYSSVQGAAGEFVIAVDYRDKEEVLGIYAVTEEYGHTVVRLSTNESRSICSRFGGCSSPEDYSFSESTSHAEMKTMRKTVLRVPGFTDIVLASEYGTRQLDLVDSSEFVGQKLVNAVSEKTGSGDVKKEFRQIQYMDLRSGVYVGYEKLTEEAGPGRVFFNTLGGNTSVDIETTEQSRQSITFRGKEIPVNTNPASVQHRSTVMISNPEIENIPCEQTRESTSEPSTSLTYTPPILKTSGAWAVDSVEHLFVSMPVLGDNPAIWTGQLFNYLTEGDLEAIIPGAPAKPGYYPGGVVK